MRSESMGSDGLIDSRAAAKLLGVTRDMVHRLARTGSLTPRYPRGKGLQSPMHFHVEEVSAFAAERERKDFDIKKLSARCAQAHALSRSLERRIAMLEKLLGKKAWPLSLEEESIIALYARARDEQEQPNFSVGNVMEWASIFMAIGDEYLDAMEAFTGDEACWRVLLHLADVMLIHAPTDQFTFDKELEAAFGYLDVGRRNLRSSAYFYIRNRFGSRIANKQLEAEECHQEVLGYGMGDW